MVKTLLQLDCNAETEKITSCIRKTVGATLKKRGLIVGLSGGIDSSTTLALCAKAIGKDRVLALLMPEQHSAEETLYLSKMVANTFGVRTEHEDITAMLEATGFYRKYNDAVQTVIPGHGPGWQSKIVSSNVLKNSGFTFFSIIARSPDGKEIRKRLDLKSYLGIIAATNFKQRIRKMLEYYYADNLNYAVVGTPNRLEYDQGFFVKNGDGAADIKPIAHLYKTQVYQLAAHLGVPRKIIDRSPTTDTYSLSQSQDEFYFSLPYEQTDLCLYGKNNNVEPNVIGSMTGLSEDQVVSVYRDIDQKRSSTRYLHLHPLLVEEIPEISEKSTSG